MLLLYTSKFKTVLGTPHQIEAMGKYTGKVERDGPETDMITLSFGIAACPLIRYALCDGR